MIAACWCYARRKSEVPAGQAEVMVRHMELVNEADLSYPVILGTEGQVMDGMHRVARCLLEGRDVVSAVQFVEQPEPDHHNVRPEDLPYG